MKCFKHILVDVKLGYSHMLGTWHDLHLCAFKTHQPTCPVDKCPIPCSNFLIRTLSLSIPRFVSLVVMNAFMKLMFFTACLLFAKGVSSEDSCDAAASSRVLLQKTVAKSELATAADTEWLFQLFHLPSGDSIWRCCSC